jgi:hypothetical protein
MRASALVTAWWQRTLLRVFIQRWKTSCLIALTQVAADLKET